MVLMSMGIAQIIADRIDLLNFPTYDKKGFHAFS